MKKYQKSDPNIVRGSWFNSIQEIKLIDTEGATDPYEGIIFADMYMKIEWGAPGKIYYSHYIYEKNNKNYARSHVKNFDANWLVIEHYFLNDYDGSGRGEGGFSGHLIKIKPLG